jgi:LSD1 subclass zinc finger protein
MPFTVSTRCPSCGAGLEYQAGSNAVKCSYCGSAHVVTGRGRILSYYFPEKITAKQAVSAALGALNKSGGAWRAREAELFFVPYYHFEAGELKWDSEEVNIGGGGGGGSGGFLGSLLQDTRGNSYSVLDEPSSAILERRFELTARHIDRTLLAINAPELDSPSLGLRPEVLKLKLFTREEVLARGKLAPIKKDIGEFRDKGYADTGDGAAAERGVFGKTESIIYSPFWIIEVTDGQNEALSVIDGISGEPLNARAPLSLLDELVDTAGKQEFETASLRPLKCPDCDADLPVRPGDLVFFCPSCLKAWYISESNFAEVKYTAAMPELKSAGEAELLPFWLVRVKVAGEGRELSNKFDLDAFSPGLMVQPRAEDKSVPLRFFIPAFGIRNLKVLSRMASGFTRRQPVFKENEPAACARGCVFSPEDSLLIAPLILFSLAPKENRRLVKFVQTARVEALACELVLVPFNKGRFEYTDAIFGWSLPAAAISD